MNEDELPSEHLSYCSYFPHICKTLHFCKSPSHPTRAIAERPNLNQAFLLYSLQTSFTPICKDIFLGVFV